MFATVGVDASACSTDIEKSIWNAVLPVPQPPCDCSQPIICSESGCYQRRRADILIPHRARRKTRQRISLRR